ncbi:MAG: DUF3124 domain-containing protein [Eudoraea sp.]|nr:DUF3124 domain-containing protein [Eudoraea sp.]NNJ39719.1 DUF3124 domain-containing protein [Eudoraea sp.]
MKHTLKIVLLIIIMQSCNDQVDISSINPVNWEKRAIEIKNIDSLTQGKTYLSVYSQIYSETEHRTHDLTVTVSMRNTNNLDTVFVNKAEYFDTKGNSIRTYFNKPIFIVPMETVEIIIDESDKEGGTGANFLFDWTIKPNSNDPLFEAIMISTSGQQGLSFSTQGKKIN